MSIGDFETARVVGFNHEVWLPRPLNGLVNSEACDTMVDAFALLLAAAPVAHLNVIVLALLHLLVVHYVVPKGANPT